MDALAALVKLDHLLFARRIVFLCLRFRTNRFGRRGGFLRGLVFGFGHGVFACVKNLFANPAQMQGLRQFPDARQSAAHSCY